MDFIEDSGIESDISDWFVDNFDLDSNCLKVSSVVDDEDNSAEITIKYSSEDWATNIPNDSDSDEDSLFYEMERLAEDELCDITFECNMEYDSIDISHESKFDWSATIRVMFNESNDDCSYDGIDEIEL